MAVHPAVQTMPSSDLWPNGFPSPTLTNPEMILPFNDNRQSSTPSPPFHRPPSPSRMNAALNSHPPEPSFIAPPLLRKKTPPPRNLWQYSDHEPADALSDIEEVESTPKSRRPRSRSRSPPLNSTSTITFNQWQEQSQEPRRYSGDSGIGGADEVVNWDGFDTVEDIEEHAGSFQPEYQDGTEYTEDDQTSTASTEFDEKSFRNSFTLGEDELSSAALSVRAERILANAKKRLTSMEGKLSEARDSLIPSPPPTKHESPFPISIGEFAAGRGISRSVSQATGERRIFYSSGQSPSQQQPHALNATGQSPPGYDGRLGIRPASALEASMGFGSRDSLLDESSPPLSDGRMHIRRASTSQRNYVPLGALRESQPAASLFDQHTQGLGISDFTSNPGVARSKSQSQMRDIRDQMNDLKGKISTLKARAKEDNIRRRSLQSLRTPSPFTSAPEQWYTSAIEYREGGLNTNAGYGWSPKSPKKLDFAESPVEEHEETAAPAEPPADQTGLARGSMEIKPAPVDAMSTVETQYEDAEETPSPTEEADDGQVNGQDAEPESIQSVQADDMLEDDLNNDDQVDDYYEERDLEVDDAEGEEALDDFLNSGPISVERHEDREDAFDYEHFILHSALGNYCRSSRRSRRGSASSESTVETARALTPSADPVSIPASPNLATKRSFTSIKSATLRPPRTHHRNDSVDSVSTFATFATATEGLDNDEEDYGGEEATFWKVHNAQEPLPVIPIPNDPNASVADKTTSWPPRTSSRGSSRPHSRANSIYITRPPRPVTAIQINGYPTPTTPKDGLLPTDLSTPTPAMGGKGLQATPSPQPTSTLVQALMAADSQRTLNFNSVDQELVEKLVESLGKVCVRMGHNAGEEVYESKIWRRRLDTARRVLEGELDLDPVPRTP